MIDSLPWSQLLWVRRIIGDEDKVDMRLEEMCNKFITRVYPKNLVYKQEAIAMDRNNLLCLIRQNRVKTERIPFVSIFGPQSGRISNVLRKHWSLIQQGCPNVEAFKFSPLMSYKRDRNPRDALVISDIGHQRTEDTQCTLMAVKMGDFPCLHCACCNNLTKGDRFMHPCTGKRFRIKLSFTCSSSYVVYVISCPCGMYYVGETIQEVK